ncbi:MAG: hypothetical protein HRU11_06805 [Parvularculaceae bacterium]|nr:hypothetical protein [Parvularculaceae bacterium]
MFKKAILAAGSLALSLGVSNASAVLVDVEAAVYDLSVSLSSVEQAIAGIAGDTAVGTFDVTMLDYPNGSNNLSSTNTVSDMIGADFASFVGTDVVLETSVWVFTGFIRLEAGAQTFNVASDDGFRLSIGGNEISRHSGTRGYRSTSVTTDAGTGLQLFELVFFENKGKTGLTFSVDGSTAMAAEPVPTPGSLALMASGGLIMVSVQRRMKPKRTRA